MITLNLPESVDLKTLSDYVSKRLELNILYSDDVGTQRVVMIGPSANAWRALRRHHRLRLVAHLDSGRTARFTVKR